MHTSEHRSHRAGYADETGGFLAVCEDLRDLAQRHRVPICFLEDGPLPLTEFYWRNVAKHRLVPALNSLVVLGRLPRYDVEYGTCETWGPFREVIREGLLRSELAAEVQEALATQCLYDSYSSLMRAEVFRTLVGDAIEDIVTGDGLVVNTGCGKGGWLAAAANDLKIETQRLVGVEPSGAGVALVRRNGFVAHHGTIASVVRTGEMKPDTATLVYEDYLIDRNPQQAETWAAEASLLSFGGILMLSGKFPVQPFDTHGRSYADRRSLITAGESVADDAERIIAHLREHDLRLCQLATGRRLFFSLDGFELLSELTLLFRKL